MHILRLPARAPCTIALVATLIGIGCPGAALALEPPAVRIVRSMPELVRVELLDGGGASGYNVYRDDAYLVTVRPPPEASAFPARVGTRGGEFCVVAFEDDVGDGGDTAYSRCSEPVFVEPGDPSMPDGEPSGPPSAPVNLRAVVYSPGVAELFWQPASDDGRVVGYRVTRDGETLAVIDGRSLFQEGLERDRTYRYTVVAIDDDGETGRAATLDLRASSADGPLAPPPGAGPMPAPPSRLRGVAYSPGVAEIFWDRSPDEASLAGYAVSRDGVPIAFIRGRSVFEPDLERGRVYRYEVAAVGPDGARSEPVSLALRAAPVPDPAAGSTVIAETGSRVLLEGDDAPLEVTLRARRPSGTDRALALSVADVTGGELGGLRVELEPSVLAPGESEASLTLALPIGMAPRLPEEREILVRVDDGVAVTETPVAIVIEPTAAPDVYLLIGQSNMEGYSERGAKRAGPGQPDEPVERVRQPNVIENNPRFFPTAEDYTDEAANLAEPLFIRAEDPLHNRLWPGRPAKSGSFVGPGLSFGKAALATTTATVYLVPAAWGATGFCANANGARAWNAVPFTDPELGGSLLLERALLRLDVTLRETGGVLRGILWHQGGADANNPRCAELYADNLVAMVRRLRTEARIDPRGASARGPDAAIPFVAATQSRGADERGDYSVYSASKQKVDDAHRSVASLLPYADVVINDDLVPPAYPCGQSSCVHFGAAALREQGARFHEALERIRARR